MTNKGLSKLLEELGELSQIAAKKLAYMDVDEHPDGKGSMKTRMEEEIGDVIAAATFVVFKFGLDQDAIDERATIKIELYEKWDADVQA
jgi:NTP pyrophosphatase (non-canonical NTP hydrolase)